MLFLAPGAESATPLPDDFKSPQTGSQPMSAATGYIAWALPGGDSLVGYDIERKRRTPAITLRNPNTTTSRVLNVTSDGQGGAYVAAEKDEASVYHYDRERNVWEPTAPPLPTLPVIPDDTTIHLAPIIASVDDREIWLVADARYLVRYDRAQKTWDAPVPLPAAIRGGHSGDNEQSVATAENGTAIYIGGRGGLWRYGKNDGAWTEKRLTVKIPTPGQIPGNWSEYPRLSALAATPDSLFTVWSLNNGGATFAARLNRRTKEWTLYDESKGFPNGNSGMRLIEAGTGSAAWLIHGYRTYLFDAKRDLWRLAFGSTSSLPTQPGDQVPDAAVVDRSLNPTEDTDSYRIVDIVTDPKSGDSFLLASPQKFTPESRAVVLRCDRAGRIIGRSMAPAGDIERVATGISLLADKGSVLVATSRGVYRAFGAGTSTWTPISPPSGFTNPVGVTRLRRDADGRGLYVISSDTVAYWIQ